MDYKQYISGLIKIDGIKSSQISELIVIPPEKNMGDYAWLLRML